MMNARIRELVNGALVAHEQDGILLPLVLEKFAELIVRECIDCLKPLSRNHSMVGAAQDTIKEHFEVEE